jgi:deoxyadenosine/deoxycytidine kinase
MDIRFLAIEGNIGAGKTTLAQKIANEKNAKIVLEQFEDNPFLPKFYENQEKYSFQLELSFLADRYNQLKKELCQYDLLKNLIISDYFFIKSLIFALQTLRDDEYNLYRRLFDIIYQDSVKPNLLVYLHRPVEQLLKNIKLRGRAYEQNISYKYLKAIETKYIEVLKQQINLNILFVNINNIDFMQNNKVYNLLLKAIFESEHKNGINTIEF